MSASFDEAKHRRDSGGKYAPKATSAADVDLSAGEANTLSVGEVHAAAGPSVPDVPDVYIRAALADPHEYVTDRLAQEPRLSGPAAKRQRRQVAEYLLGQADQLRQSDLWGYPPQVDPGDRCPYGWVKNVRHPAYGITSVDVEDTVVPGGGDIYRLSEARNAAVPEHVRSKDGWYGPSHAWVVQDTHPEGVFGHSGADKLRDAVMSRPRSPGPGYEKSSLVCDRRAKAAVLDPNQYAGEDTTGDWVMHEARSRYPRAHTVQVTSSKAGSRVTRVTDSQGRDIPGAADVLHQQARDPFDRATAHASWKNLYRMQDALQLSDLGTRTITTKEN